MLGFVHLVEPISRFVAADPTAVATLLLNALRLRLGVPVEALEWLLRRRAADSPRDVVVVPSPPGLRISMTLDVMDTPMRASTVLFVDEIDLANGRIALRLEEIDMQVLDGAATPVAALVRSGALDLTKAGSLAAQMPRARDLLGSSHGNRLVIDLFKHPALRHNARFKRALEIGASLLAVQSVTTDRRNLYVALRALPQGLLGAGRALFPLRIA